MGRHRAAQGPPPAPFLLARRPASLLAGASSPGQPGCNFCSCSQRSGGAHRPRSRGGLPPLRLGAWPRPPRKSGYGRRCFRLLPTPRWH
eukprot:8368083-Alexandrium_andersonii.AAC.1